MLLKEGIKEGGQVSHCWVVVCAAGKRSCGSQVGGAEKDTTLLFQKLMSNFDLQSRQLAYQCASVPDSYRPGSSIHHFNCCSTY